MNSALAGPKRLAPPPGAIDVRRGTLAMEMFILTEAMLFLMLFFTYFYLGHSQPKWPTDAPKLRLALPMLAILVSSSFVLYWGEQGEKKGNEGRARLGVTITMIMGAVFIVLQVFEYMDRMKTILATSDSYGSIFYTITSLHGAHVVLGLLMLAYVQIMPKRQWGPAHKPPHHVLHNVGLYWHFVDAVWVFIVGLLYVMPNLQS